MRIPTYARPRGEDRRGNRHTRQYSLCDASVHQRHHVRMSRLRKVTLSMNMTPNTRHDPRGACRLFLSIQQSIGSEPSRDTWFIGSSSIEHFLSSCDNKICALLSTIAHPAEPVNSRKGKPRRRGRQGLHRMIAAGSTGTWISDACPA